eukprot:1810665-Amphidinium_carterae.1
MDQPQDVAATLGKAQRHPATSASGVQKMVRSDEIWVALSPLQVLQLWLPSGMLPVQGQAEKPAQTKQKQTGKKPLPSRLTKHWEQLEHSARELPLKDQKTKFNLSW